MATTSPPIADLRAILPDGALISPGDPAWDQARAAYNLTLDQRPVAVAMPGTEDEVAAVVRVAGERGLRVAAQSTGHGAGALPSLDGVVLLRTGRMTGVELDPAAHRARARAGARWADAVVPADAHGLATLCGSSPTVGIAGYSLGGGVGWLARRHGLAANAVQAVELVTADGRKVRADAEHDPDLFWALRGGGGSFGVVTALEFALIPVPALSAGVLFWPLDRAGDVLHAWRGWTAGVPDEMTSVGRMLRLPPLPELPDFLRGRSFVVVEAAFLGGEADAGELMAPLRALGPEMDTFGVRTPAGLAELHMDPPEPVPYGGDGGLLTGLPDEAVDAALAVMGPGAETPLLSLELRHLGGALAAAPPGAGALGALHGGFLWFAVGIAPVSPAVAAVRHALEVTREALTPWDSGRSYLNFAETGVSPDRLWDPEAAARLRAVRARVDPDGRFLANHTVPLG